MAEDGEVVDSHDRGWARAERAAVRGAVQDVDAGTPRRSRQPGRVPRELAREGRGAPVAAEAEAADLDVRTAVELPEQRPEVARRPGPRLRERRHVDADPHGDRVCQRASA